MRLYAKYVSISLRSAMQYKSAFVMTALGQFLVSFSAFLGIYFMFDRFGQVEGFTLSEVLLCYGAVYMAFALAEMIGRGFDLFSSMIANGEFDRALVRPRGLILQVMGSKFELSRVGRLLQAGIVFAWAIPNSGVEWTAARTTTLVLMVACGFVTFCALFVVGATFSFFTLEALEVVNIFTDGGREFGQYPFSIYGRGVLRFLTFVVPLALFQYYPFLYLIGRAPAGWYALLPLAGLLFLIPVGLFWRFGLRHYKSTGS